MNHRKASGFDHVVERARRPFTLPAFCMLLGIFLVWFGGLEFMERSPVAGIVAQTLPFTAHRFVVLALAAGELGLGIVLISGVLIRVVLLALGAMGFPAKEELSVEPPLQEQVVENRTTVEQPYNGRWRVSHNGAAIGAVNGDFVIGFTARDQHGSVLGTFSTSEGALDAVLDN